MELGIDGRALARRAGRVGLVLGLLVALAAGCRGAPDAATRTGAGEAPAPLAEAPSPGPSEPEAGPATPEPAPPAPEAARAAAAEGLSDPAELASALKEHRSDQWYGVYMLGKKIGHARVWLRPSREGEPGSYTTGTELRMTVRGLLGEARMELSESRHYAGEPPYALVETRMRSQASGVEDVRVGRNTPAGMEIRRTTGGRVAEPRTVPASAESLASLFLTTPLRVSNLRVGQRASAAWFNWEAEKDDLVHVEVREVRKGLHAGVETTLAALDVRYEKLGATATSLVADDGVVVETSLGQGLVLKLEEQDVAQSDVEGLDVMGSGIPAGRRLGRPNDIAELTLKVKTPEGYALPSAPNQEVTPLGDGWSRVVLRARPGAPVTPEERAAALESDATMDADAPSVRAKAQDLTADAATDADKARRIGEWVYRNLDKQLATHLPTASTILDKEVGDCTEHTWLFVALARAAGLPARPVYGLGYTGDAYASFGYHAWAEVAIDGHWVAVDPTWGEEVADATHLRLAAELSDVAGVMGGLQIEVEGEPVRR